jgi:hypothetical protein
VRSVGQSLASRVSQPRFIHICFATPEFGQIVRTTKSLPVAQNHAGWSRLQMAYLSITDEEVRAAMAGVTE